MTTAPDLVAQIQRLYTVEKWRVGTIARQLHVHRDVVRRVVAGDCAPVHPSPASFSASSVSSVSMAARSKSAGSTVPTTKGSGFAGGATLSSSVTREPYKVPLEGWGITLPISTYS